MTSRLLHERLHEALAVLRAPRPALGPALEALALCAAAGVSGALDSLPARERQAATAAGAKLLLQARGAPADDDELAFAAALAAEGLEALRGTKARDAASPLHPSPAALVAMSHGEPDALTAATAAAHVRRCASCRDALAVATAPEEERAAPLRIAAEALPLRAPGKGKSLGKLAKLGVEAVLFVDEDARRVAVYGGPRATLRLVADALKTEDLRPGYWLGRVAARVTKIDAVLHVDDARVPWKLVLR